ncbi:MAG: YIP1 family protein, partial [Candidatus Izemoplasmatales bacterium]
MKRLHLLRSLIVIVSTLVVVLTLGFSSTDIHAAATPYTTFTTDNENGYIETYDAYTPNGQITGGTDVTFKTLEYVYIDSEDYIYISDSGSASVYVFDSNHQYVNTISFFGDDNYPAFYAVNSVFVSGDKVYIPDSFAKAVYIFDRNEVINPPQAYNLWVEDVDLDDELSDGDLVYVADKETGLPIGSAVYTIGIGGMQDTYQIYEFKDITTGEVLFEKVNILEFMGKFLGHWQTTTYEGKTLLKLGVYAEKVVPKQVVMTPDAPVFESYTFAPRRVVADKRGNMYIVGARSDNGLIMLNFDGEFVTFFGGNAIRTPILDQIRSIILSETQQDKLLALSDISIDYISGVAIDKKGFIYTVTSTLENDNIKKFNVSGTNYLEGDIHGWVGSVDIKVGAYNNIIAVDEYGWIYEYDADGRLIFAFCVKETGNGRDGLLKLPKSIAIDSHDNLYVVDQGNKFVQIYKSTEFTDSIHTALKAYQDGDEVVAQENWQYALSYATVFDLAHIGLGDSYVRQEQFDLALQEYILASDKQGISDTFWQVRQFWLEDNLNTVFISIIAFFVLLTAYKIVNKKYHYSDKYKKWIQSLRKKSKTFDELLYIGTFLKHPIDGYYEIKRNKRVSVRTASIIYILLGFVYVFYQKVTNIIFLDTFQPNIMYNLIIITAVLLLWVVANYFVCLIADGEGSFKNVYTATAMSFTPILFIVPVVSILSNVLTYQEAVFFQGPLTFTTLWVAIYFFFMIKEIHNYEVGETVKIIIKSMFTML